MKVLIAGGFGYVGGRLAQFLGSRPGYAVVLGSRRAAAPPAWLPSAHTVQLQWDDDGGLERACAGVDAVVHAAGMDAQACRADPVAALAFHGVGTGRLLRAAERAGVGRFVYLSTAHVYGALSGVVTESTCPVSLEAYATSHRAGEDVVRAARSAGAAAIALRLSNAYGAPADAAVACWDLVMNDLCRQAVTTGGMVLRSPAMQRRNFIPMRDVTAAIEHLLQTPAARLGDGLFNVGSTWSPTLREAAALVQERCEVVAGFRPELRAASARAPEASLDLEYRCDALLKTGFEPSDDHAGELDGLIEYWRARTIK